MTITVRNGEAEPRCTCKACEQGQRLRAICDKLPPDDARWLKDFRNEFLSLHTDEQYYRNIVDGSWPDAVDILTSALERAKAKQEIAA
jgi:hypothetical protein